MPPFTVQRLAQPAAKAEKKATEEFKDIGGEIRCRFACMRVVHVPMPHIATSKPGSDREFWRVPRGLELW